MVSHGDKWVRIFDIADTSKHKKGYTIYKIISMLYPDSCPDAVTKVTVWKRFSDLKKLHQEIKAAQKKLGINDKLPSLPGSTFFKRFDDEIIQERRQSILNFLEYVAHHHQLFTCNAFVKFFETSHTPVDQLNSNINLIRAELQLPEDDLFNAQDEDDPTISDTDSVTTVNSLSSSVQQINDVQRSKLSINTSTANSSHPSTKCNNSDSASISTIDSFLMLDGQMYPSPPNTPGSYEDYEQYIIDASIHVSMAMELEQAKKYEEAFTAYHTAADILLKHGLDDKNSERRQMLRYKSGKYLIRAERIYNMHLASEVNNLKQISEVQEDDEPDQVIQRPISDLYKYKVVKILGSGMLVLHSETQQLFYIKVIHKTMQFLEDNLILPENVPYMVKLHNYHNCENALFLVLEYCSCKKLWDYVQSYAETLSETFHEKSCDQHHGATENGSLSSKKVDELELSDAESDHSYADLISAYARNKRTPQDTTTDLICDESVDFIEGESVDTSIQSNNNNNNYGKPKDLDSTDFSLNKSLNSENSENSEIADLFPSVLEAGDFLITTAKSQQNSTFDNHQLLIDDRRNFSMNNKDRDYDNGVILRQRSFSEMSSFDDLDLTSQSVLTIPVDKVVKWSAQLLLALEKLHILGVICGDLQTDNLLINEEGDLILTYMCNVNELSDMFISDGKSVNFAPEIYGFQPLTPTIDWWCYGAILYELLVGMPLFTVHPDGLAKGVHLKIPKYVSAEGRSLVRQLLTFEPQDRLGYGPNGTENIKTHPFFSSVNWSDLLAKFAV